MFHPSKMSQVAARSASRGSRREQQQSDVRRFPNNPCFPWKLRTGREHTLEHLDGELFVLFGYFFMRF